MEQSDTVTIRPLTQQNIPDLFFLITKLAEYEQLTEELTLTEEKLRKAYFGEQIVAHAILAYLNDTAIGYASYFFNFSTFKAQNGLYLEDLFVLESHRNQRIGHGLIHEILSIAKKNNCGWIEGLVLDWNRNARTFYKELGAEAHPEWIQYIFPLDSDHADRR